jgi:hypothetical protein
VAKDGHARKKNADLYFFLNVLPECNSYPEGSIAIAAFRRLGMSFDGNVEQGIVAGGGTRAN